MQHRVGLTVWALGRERLFESHPDSPMHRAMADPVLYELFEPERQRQRTEIIKAIDRVREVIEASKDRSTQLDANEGIHSTADKPGGG